ncbi:hypothetical protein M440DRAFT_1112175 [Trichoderma longibrachiatum ATCC 18648]|uniref:Uncharacterized protein n=1 Tax=Trichoderma longibrachiatum ATCC 18648 TaxID=983965 RepID=A0A2T4CEX0_TRILO|nr:hypothetical protein M440DRAFT_1112175 [Trichoderma longibrachiatum ATCC 18648]
MSTLPFFIRQPLVLVFRNLLQVASVHFLIQSPRLASPCPSPLVPHFEPEAGRQNAPPMAAKPCLVVPLWPCLVSVNRVRQLLFFPPRPLLLINGWQVSRFFSLSDAASAIDPGSATGSIRPEKRGNPCPPLGGRTSLSDARPALHSHDLHAARMLSASN